jgi:hypothetical protein
MTDRIIVYPGSIPQDTDLLKTNQNAMVALGFLAQATLGTGTSADGLDCTPTIPASLSVLVSAGSIYSVQNLESTSYGSLPSDTDDQIVKQGIVLGNTSFTITPPTTSGQSRVYLVQAQFEEVDGGETVLPYFNAANQDVPYSGPANDGSAQNTERQGKCILSLKAGTAASTGSQVTPTPDAGFVGLWAITVANGASTITSGNIAQYPGAPFIGNKLTQRVAKVQMTSFTAAGSYTYTPDPRLLYATVEIGGAGGGGGGGHDTTFSGGCGGSAGGYSKSIYTAAQIGASQAVTIGAGGASGTHGTPGTSGGSGETTSFGTLMVANGGTGGGWGDSTHSATPSNGGTATGGTFNAMGSAGQVGYGASSPNAFCFGGVGGSSAFGGGGVGGNEISGVGGNGLTGSGGGAACGNNDGGKGGDGVCIITEYCY